METFKVVLGPESQVTARRYPAESPERPALLILAHGAGAGQDHPFMTACARGLASRGVTIVTFNFAYTERRSSAPNPAPQLEACFRRVIETVLEHGWLEGTRLFLGGKSMGGRMASHLAAAPQDVAAPIAGLVFLGYPLRPPGRPDKVRSAHLPAIAAPMLFVQGTRDAFGTPDDLAPIVKTLHAPTKVLPIQNGDHSFKVSGIPRGEQAQVIERILDEVARWIGERVPAG